MPEQLPSPTNKYMFGGQVTLANFEIPENSRSFEEDAETLNLPDGRFSTKVTYSRRETLRASARCLTSATPATFLGGTIASGVFKLADGATDTAWKIRSAEIRFERGIRMVDFDLIQIGDKLA
jgi:hypothetical protein